MNNFSVRINCSDIHHTVSYLGVPSEKLIRQQSKESSYPAIQGLQYKCTYDQNGGGINNNICAVLIMSLNLVHDSDGTDDLYKSYLELCKVI